MVKRCIVCGKKIRTGWKYCYEHRNTPAKRDSIDKTTFGIAVFLTLGILLLISKMWVFAIWCLIIGLVLFYFKYKPHNIFKDKFCGYCGKEI